MPGISRAHTIVLLYGSLPGSHYENSSYLLQTFQPIKIQVNSGQLRSVLWLVETFVDYRNFHRLSGRLLYESTVVGKLEVLGFRILIKCTYVCERSLWCGDWENYPFFWKSAKIAWWNFLRKSSSMSSSLKWLYLCAQLRIVWSF